VGRLPLARGTRQTPEVEGRMHGRHSEQAWADRQVAGEVGEGAIPADEDRETIEAETGAQGGDNSLVGGTADPCRKGTAWGHNRGEMPQDRRDQGRVACGHGPEAAGLTGIAIAQRRPVGAVVQPAPAAFAAEEPMVHRVSRADHLAIKGVDRFDQAAMSGTPRRTGHQRVERDRDDA
jgi:hypothetical protein